MSAVSKFPWPLPDSKAESESDPKPDPKLEFRSRFECESFPSAENDVQHESSLRNAAEGAAIRRQQNEGLESVGRLAGGVAHDFNNLLTGVLLYCDLILATNADDRVRRYAGEIRNAGLQATGLVRQLLAVARPMSCDPCLVSLNDTAEGLRNLLASLIGENIELRFRLHPNLGLVKMNPAQAQQILLNLVLNARDAMPDGGQITVETGNCLLQIVSDQTGVDPKQHDDAAPSKSSCTPGALPCVLFVVEDSGGGMDPATQAHLFEAFFTTKPAGKGTGLGLATVHDIVTGNGGLIHVESAPGRGTRFTVLLPLIPPNQNSQPATASPEIEGEFPAEEVIRKGITL